MAKRRNLFGFITNSIPYHKELRPIAGSVTSAILMRQLEYWFEKYPDGFYKFLEPSPNNEKYKEGDSWSEELAFSPDEFRTAFDKIGIRYKSKNEFDSNSNSLFNSQQGEKFYCSYHDKIKGITWYFRNSRIGSIIDDIINLRNSTIPIYGDGQSQFTELGNGNLQYYITENTSENTSERGGEKPPTHQNGFSKEPTTNVKPSNGISAKTWNQDLLESPENYSEIEIRLEAGKLADKFICETFAPAWERKTGKPYVLIFGDPGERVLLALIEDCIKRKISMREITRRMQNYFNSNDPYLEKTRHYDLKTFASQFNEFVEPKILKLS